MRGVSGESGFAVLAVRARFAVTRFFFAGGLFCGAAFVFRIDSTSCCRVFSVLAMLHYLADQSVYFRSGIGAAATHVEHAATLEGAPTVDGASTQGGIRDRQRYFAKCLPHQP
jgi:hypothetical protein